jgi:hypothetical protein
MERPEHQTAIYKKAKDIQTLVESLIELVRESDFPKADDFDLDLIREKLTEMEENAQEIPILISEASLSTMPYDFRMENAVFVKSAALELIEDVLYIEEMGLKDIDYLDLLYDEVEALRVLFIEWIKTFDLWKYEGEDWGLFAPEGIKLIELIEEDEDDFGMFDDEEDVEEDD